MIIIMIIIIIIKIMIMVILIIIMIQLLLLLLLLVIIIIIIIIGRIAVVAVAAETDSLLSNSITCNRGPARFPWHRQVMAPLTWTGERTQRSRRGFVYAVSMATRVHRLTAGACVCVCVCVCVVILVVDGDYCTSSSIVWSLVWDWRREAGRLNTVEKETGKEKRFGQLGRAWWAGGRQSAGIE